MATLQKAIAVANSYHGCALRRCNEAKLIADALAAHESHDGVAEVLKALQKVRRPMSRSRLSSSRSPRTMK